MKPAFAALRLGKPALAALRLGKPAFAVLRLGKPEGEAKADDARRRAFMV